MDCFAENLLLRSLQSASTIPARDQRPTCSPVDGTWREKPSVFLRLCISNTSAKRADPGAALSIDRDVMEASIT
jgi:hypothetical protein